MEIVEEEEEDEIVTLIMVRMPDVCKNGFGTQYHLLAPEGFG